MFWRTPPLIMPTVTTAGSRVRSTWRLTTVCRPSTTCAAVTIGSTPNQGIAPCVCRPSTLMLNESALAMVGPGPVAEHAERQPRGDVQAEHRLRHRLLERALGDHHLRAALLALGRQLLGRLEDELDRAAQLAAQPGEHLGHAHQDGDVGVVAAGVHDADRLAVPLRLHLRGEREVDLLGHRQRVHVGAQRHHRAGQRALQQADHAGVGDAGAHLVEAEPLQVLGDDAGGAELAVAELGVGMDVASPGDHPALDLLGGGVDLVGERRGGDGGFEHEISSMSLGEPRSGPRPTGAAAAAPASMHSACAAAQARSTHGFARHADRRRPGRGRAPRRDGRRQRDRPDRRAGADRAQPVPPPLADSQGRVRHPRSPAASCMPTSCTCCSTPSPSGRSPSAWSGRSARSGSSGSTPRACWPATSAPGSGTATSPSTAPSAPPARSPRCCSPRSSTSRPARSTSCRFRCRSRRRCSPSPTSPTPGSPRAGQDGRINHDAHLSGALAGIAFVALTDGAAFARAWQQLFG